MSSVLDKINEHIEHEGMSECTDCGAMYKPFSWGQFAGVCIPCNFRLKEDLEDEFDRVKNDHLSQIGWGAEDDMPW